MNESNQTKRNDRRNGMTTNAEPNDELWDANDVAR